MTIPPEPILGQEITSDTDVTLPPGIFHIMLFVYHQIDHEEY